MVKSKELKALENSAVELSITIEKESIKKEYDELLGKYAKSAHIKGFRKGKVPTAVLERKFGDSLKLETGYNLVEKGMEEVLKDVEKKPLPHFTPKLQDEENFSVDLEKDLVFTVMYETYPDITLGQYKGIEIEIPEVEITKEDEDRELKRYQEQNAVVTEKKDGTVEKDNVVTINYSEVDENEKNIDGTAREGFTFTVGTGYNYYKIDDDIIGFKLNEEKIIEKKFADDFEYKELAGKSVKIKLKVTSIKSKQLPKIDDDLAQDINEKYKTLDDLKKDINERQKGIVEMKLKELKRRRVLDKVIAASTLEVPPSMIENELSHSWSNFLNQVGSDEQKVLQILAAQNKTKESLLEEWKPSAINSVKAQLIMNQITKEEKIEISDEEAADEINKQAAKSGMAEEDFKKYIEENNVTEYIKHSLREQKAYDLLIENGVVKQGDKVGFLAFISLNN
ncbi:MAG: trigger factor [Spirochaetes bacterium]|nr:trigger factor [Spirochaetota bacterium]